MYEVWIQWFDGSTSLYLTTDDEQDAIEFVDAFNECESYHYAYLIFSKGVDSYVDEESSKVPF